MRYLVLEKASYRGGETKTVIKGIYDDFSQADNLAKKLYKVDLEYYKSDGNYDNIKEGEYKLFLQSDTCSGQGLLLIHKVIELEYEINEECKIEL